jgi:glycosyltransferase involved in cell wall biosynthesis
MASGLVPVTNAVAAIPEFVDEQCGMLASNEDWQALADAILELYKNPELFKQLSSNAASRVRAQSSTEHIVKKELELIGRV